LNPYAKKNSNPVSNAATPSTSSSILASTKTQGGGPINPYKQRKTAVEQKQQSTQKQISQPPPPTVNEFTTFSQAFGNVDPDSEIVGEEQKQQLAFDRSIVSIADNDSYTNTGVTPRDNQAMLQPHILHISTRQRGNPIIEHIRNVPYKFSELVPDYIMAATRCALFLSLRYHNLHPNYIHRRVAELKSDFEYRMLLCLVDIEDSAASILFLNDLCVQNNLTLILAWSEEEAARYLETVRAFDGKDPTPVIGKHEPKTHIEKIIRALGSVPSVNKSDASQLLTQFGCFRNLVNASIDELSLCPGIGPKKVRRLHEAFHRPFTKDNKKKRKEAEKECKKEDEDDEPGGEHSHESLNTDAGTSIGEIGSKDKALNR
jgi:DNA excision repair protein ERCC-1